jgi:hypothetical protein
LSPIKEPTSVLSITETEERPKHSWNGSNDSIGMVAHLGHVSFRLPLPPFHQPLPLFRLDTRCASDTQRRWRRGWRTPPGDARRVAPREGVRGGGEPTPLDTLTEARARIVHGCGFGQGGDKDFGPSLRLRLRLHRGCNTPSGPEGHDDVSEVEARDVVGTFPVAQDASRNPAGDFHTVRTAAAAPCTAADDCCTRLGEGHGRSRLGAGAGVRSLGGAGAEAVFRESHGTAPAYRTRHARGVRNLI